MKTRQKVLYLSLPLSIPVISLTICSKRQVLSDGSTVRYYRTGITVWSHEGEAPRHDKIDFTTITDPTSVMSTFSGTDYGQLQERNITSHGCEDSAITTGSLSGSLRKLFDLGEESNKVRAD